MPIILSDEIIEWGICGMNDMEVLADKVREMAPWMTPVQVNIEVCEWHLTAMEARYANLLQT